MAVKVIIRNSCNKISIVINIFFQVKFSFDRLCWLAINIRGSSHMVRISRGMDKESEKKTGEKLRLLSLNWFIRSRLVRLIGRLCVVELIQIIFSSVQSLSRVQIFATPWIAAHQASLFITISQFTQTHVHWVSDAIQPLQPWSSPSPPFPSPSQHQSPLQWVNSSHEVAKVLEFQLQYHSFQRNPRVDLLQNGLVGFPCSPRDSQESSPTPQFKSINSLALSLLHSPTLTSIHDHRKNQSLDLTDLSRQSNVSAFEYTV